MTTPPGPTSRMFLAGRIEGLAEALSIVEAPTYRLVATKAVRAALEAAKAKQQKEASP